MSEYTIQEESRQRTGKYSHSNTEWVMDEIVFMVIAPDGSIAKEFSDCDYDYTMQAKAAAQGYANEHNLAYFRKEIASLQDSLATLLAAAEVRSEELGKARGFIRELAERVLNGEPAINEQMAYVAAHTYYDFKERAQALVASWEAETTPEPASGGFTGYVAKIKKVVTRNNEVMATMFINGNECIAFPRTWQEYGKVLESGKELQIVYKEDNSKGYPQFIIESAGLLYEEAESEAVKPKPFKVGDKVRIRDRNDEMGIKLFYSNVPYDTIVFINEQGVHQLEYGADGSLSSGPWEASHLEPYTELIEAPDSAGE